MGLSAGALIGFLCLFTPPQNDPTLELPLKKFQEDFFRRGAREEDRILAMRALAQYHHERVVKTLAPLMTESTLAVRVMTARELGLFVGVEAAPRELLAALRSPANAGKKEASVRIEILRGLGLLKYQAAATDVAKAVEDKEVWVAKAAIDAAGRIRTADAMTPLIKALQRIEGRNGDAEVVLNPLDELFPEFPTASGLLKPDARQTAKKPSEREVLKAPILAALQSISRQTFESAKEWDTWWTKRKGNFRLAE